MVVSVVVAVVAVAAAVVAFAAVVFVVVDVITGEAVKDVIFLGCGVLPSVLSAVSFVLFADFCSRLVAAAPSFEDGGEGASSSSKTNDWR